MGVLITINVLFMIFFFVLAYMSIRYFINQIEKYPRITLEEVYNSKKLRMKYNIEDKVNPMDYGYNYQGKYSFTDGCWKIRMQIRL